jgi:hypothetical protein
MRSDLKGLQRIPALKKERPAIFTAADIIEHYVELTVQQRREITRRLAEMAAAADQS